MSSRYAGSASKSPASVRCTNRLVLFPSPSQVVWSYNIGLHYDMFHLGKNIAIYESQVATRAEFISILLIKEEFFLFFVMRWNYMRKFAIELYVKFFHHNILTWPKKKFLLLFAVYSSLRWKKRRGHNVKFTDSVHV